jgi:hypothetical protein
VQQTGHTKHSKPTKLSVLIVFPLAFTPALVLIFSLYQAGQWNNAIAAIQGQHSVNGVPYNPWMSFWLYLLIPVGVSSALVGLASKMPYVLHRIPIMNYVLLVGAAIIFGAAAEIAAIAPSWFAGQPVIGSVGSPLRFWIATASTFIVLFAAHRRQSDET